MSPPGRYLKNLAAPYYASTLLVIKLREKLARNRWLCFTIDVEMGKEIFAKLRGLSGFSAAFCSMSGAASFSILFPR
jgi:hypothetical protein